MYVCSTSYINIYLLYKYFFLCHRVHLLFENTNGEAWNYLIHKSPEERKAVSVEELKRERGPRRCDFRFTFNP